MIKAYAEYMENNIELILDRVNSVVKETGEGDVEDVERWLGFKYYDLALEYLIDIAFRAGCNLDYILGRSDVFSVF